MQTYILNKLRTPKHSFNTISTQCKISIFWCQHSINTISTQHQSLTTVETLLIFSYRCLFCNLLTFFNDLDHSLEFVQYLEFAFDHIPINICICMQDIPITYVLKIMIDFLFSQLWEKSVSSFSCIVHNYILLSLSVNRSPFFHFDPFANRSPDS